MKKIFFLLIGLVAFQSVFSQETTKKKVDVPGDYSTHTPTTNPDGSTTLTIHCTTNNNSVCYTIEQCGANAGDPDPVFDNSDINLINTYPVQIVILQNGYYLGTGLAVTYTHDNSNPLISIDSFVLIN